MSEECQHNVRKGLGMIAYTVNYPLAEWEKPEKEFLSEVIQWAKERKNTKIAPDWDGSMGTARWENNGESLSVICHEGGGAFRHRSESDRCVWTLEGALSSENGILRLTLDVTSESGIICRFAHIPTLFTRLIQKGMIRGTLEETFRGKWLTLSGEEMQKAAEDILSGKTPPHLPVIFISEKYRKAFEAETPALCMIAETAFIPAGLSLSGRLPDDGIFAIFPDAEAVFTLNKSQYNCRETALTVLTAVRNYYLQKNVPDTLTFSGLEKKELTESLLKAGKTTVENTQLVGELEAALKENDELKKEIQELEAKIRSLDAKSETLGSSLSNALAKDTGEPLLFYGKEKDMFPEEISDFVLEALSDKMDELPDGSRRKDVYNDLLTANHYSEKHRKIREKIGTAFTGYKTMDSSIRQVLKESGLEIKSDSKHIKIAFPGDGRYTEIIPKTCSDSVRAGLNIAKDIGKTMM